MDEQSKEVDREYLLRMGRRWVTVPANSPLLTESVPTVRLNLFRELKVWQGTYT